MNAQDLKTGDLLHADTGQIVEVKNVRSTVGLADMHDLTVDQVHTYYVLAADQPVLVHNCGTEDFAHGTKLEHGQAILSNGVDEIASRANLFGSKSPGSFYTVPVNQADKQAAIDAAAGWGARQGGQTCVIVCRLPNQVVRELESQGLLVRTDIPNQAIFHPGAFDTLKKHAEWFGPIT